MGSVPVSGRQSGWFNGTKKARACLKVIALALRLANVASHLVDLVDKFDVFY